MRIASSSSLSAFNGHDELLLYLSIYFKGKGSISEKCFPTIPQVLYAGSEGGCIHGWDLRGGTQGAFMRASEDYHRPICRLVLADLLQSLISLSVRSASFDGLF